MKLCKALVAVLFAALASALLLCGPALPSARAQGCGHYGRYYTPPYYQTNYYQPTYYPTYHAPTYSNVYQPYDTTIVVKDYNYRDVVLVPLVQKVVVSPDYFFSVRDYYRDAIQLELLQQLRQSRQNNVGPSTPPPGSAPERQGPQGKLDAAGFDPALATVVQSSCLRCHGGEQGTKGNFSLVSLGAVSLDGWLECYERVLSGDMPRGGNPLANAEAKLFFDQVKKASRVAKK